MPVLRGLHCLSREEMRKRGDGEAAEGMEHSEWAFGVGKQFARGENFKWQGRDDPCLLATPFVIEPCFPE